MNKHFKNEVIYIYSYIYSYLWPGREGQESCDSLAKILFRNLVPCLTA